MPEVAAPDGVYMPNREDVAAKVIDGELIVIRLSDGTYYSMDNVGTCIWELIEAGHPVTDLVRSLADRYATPVERVEADVVAFVGELLAEGLLVPVASGSPTPPAAARPAAELAYETPRINVYRDMGNLLALDPPTPGIDDLVFKGPKAD